MESGLKLILKTLIKVPIVVFVCYFVFNLIMLLISYIRMLVLSFLVMFTAISNNYIPPEEQYILENHFAKMETVMLHDIKFTEDTLTQPRVQYGDTVIVGVTATFDFANPLTPNEYLGDVSGTENTNTGTPSANQVEDIRENKVGVIELKFEYEVPGLKYYPDLD